MAVYENIRNHTKSSSISWFQTNRLHIHTECVYASFGEKSVYMQVCVYASLRDFLDVYMHVFQDNYTSFLDYIMSGSIKNERKLD